MSKRPEIISDTKETFGNAIKKLNRIFIMVDRYKRKDHVNLSSLMKKLGPLLKAKENNILEKLFLLINEETRPIDEDIGYTFLRERKHILPVIGKKKNKGNLYNQGFIMGLEIKISDNYLLKYRVDFDPVKKLHINFYVIFDDITYPYALKTKPGSMYYETEGDEAIKYKFFIKASLAYFHFRGGFGKLNTISNTENVVIANVLTRKDFNLNTLTTIISPYYKSSDQIPLKTLSKAKNSEAAMELLYLNYQLRHAFVEAAVAEYSKYTISLEEKDINSEEAPKSTTLSDEPPKVEVKKRFNSTKEEKLKPSKNPIDVLAKRYKIHNKTPKSAENMIALVIINEKIENQALELIISILNLRETQGLTINLNSMNKQNQTLLDLANKFNRRDIASLLEKEGAKTGEALTLVQSSQYNSFVSN